MTAETGQADNIKEPEETSRILRVLTVGFYIFSVSGFSLLLASYYLFLWSEWKFLKKKL
jgi:hypothetical protein